MSFTKDRELEVRIKALEDQVQQLLKQSEPDPLPALSDMLVRERSYLILVRDKGLTFYTLSGMLIWDKQPIDWRMKKIDGVDHLLIRDDEHVYMFRTEDAGDNRYHYHFIDAVLVDKIFTPNHFYRIEFKHSPAGIPEVATIYRSDFDHDANCWPVIELRGEKRTPHERCVWILTVDDLDGGKRQFRSTSKDSTSWIYMRKLSDENGDKGYGNVH